MTAQDADTLARRICDGATKIWDAEQRGVTEAQLADPYQRLARLAVDYAAVTNHPSLRWTEEEPHG